MKKKKKLKVLLITLLCLVLAAGAIVSYFVFFAPNKRLQNPLAKPVETNRYQIAQVAVFNEKYSNNYNGNYKFSRINYIDFSSFSSEEIKIILNFYDVDDTMSLIYNLAKQKRNETQANTELLIIQDSRFQFNHGDQPATLGSIYGNDDFSVLYDTAGNKLCSVSLTRLSPNELKNLSKLETNTYHGDEMFLSKPITIWTNETSYTFDVIYVYKIQK